VRLLVQHRSHYRYPEPALLGAHTLRLHPTGHAKAHVETYHLSCEQAERIQWTIDPYGNKVARVSFDWDRRFSELDILVELVVEVRSVNPFDFFVDHRVEQLGFEYPPEYALELSPFLGLDDPAFAIGERFESFLAEMPHEGRTVDAIVEMNTRVNQRIQYVIREEAGVWTPEETLTQGRGSCRDSAMLLVALLRRRGIAARFVSGYLIQVTDEGMLPDLPKGLDHDVVDLHAWAEAYIPGAGWIGLDATSGLLCTEGHVPLACAATPTLAAPLHGTAEMAAEQVEFRMSVARLGHEPRPTAPYTDEVWERLREAGKRTDRKLAALGVRLTMGGEPTFTARENIELPEWNGDALGQDKWVRGVVLTEQLRDRLHPGGVLLQRMGKHYPGESLPRWALDAIGRVDGRPLWQSRDEASWARPQRSDAEKFAKALAKALGLVAHLEPAYEDPWHFVREEARIPKDVDPLDFDLRDGETRARLSRILDKGLGDPAGWVLPLRREDERWVSGLWSFRRNHLFLLPGDSPVGLRLPLDSIQGRPLPIAQHEPKAVPEDPRRKVAEAEAAGEGPTQLKRVGQTSDDGRIWSVHTALCVEWREHLHDERGALYVFLPPLERQHDFIDLVAVIDRVRAELKLPVVLEGYGPPPGRVLSRITVTPDPGVLEVNIPPSETSEAYVDLMQTIYDAGLHAGLHTEKHMLDGRQAGSGGGHHLTFGGPTALESPFVTRPELLASLITFLQHHPSLSYMFTGLFVGPTSQAPRVDEARHDQLHELEIALAHAFAQAGRQNPPWLGDLLFRDLLVDVTGNGHRTELSIDKLFDWRSPGGRQGLVEFRAFEMPPHPRMAVAQMLLMRSVLAALAERPQAERLVRFGAGLHDKYLLPYWMWQDFEDVLEFLARRELELDPDCFRPFVELRCPLIGQLQTRDVHLELRNAIEPWNVLGEEPGSGGGTARYVDSSVERVEVRVRGLVPERHAVLVNGHVLTLRPTEHEDLWVAGVRFRAWAPPHSLHAHLGIHHPLHFDVVDRWARRSLGACTYHVWHPEGRAFESPPLTRFEAAARRSQRFTRGNQSVYPIRWEQLGASPWLTAGALREHGPYTVDLRRLDLDRPMPEPPDEEAPLVPVDQPHVVVGWPGTSRRR
jgi:uncharacterized protein (DUF2126 family)/transglutaminase-like putative cysteine protease